MNFLNEHIGSAKDNIKSPIHSWYKYTAGFSYRFVEEIIKQDKLSSKNLIYDPFAGCGTTLVSSQKLGVPAVGNESQQLMYDIIKAKINWSIDINIVIKHTEALERNIISNADDNSISHELVKDLYTEENLILINKIKNYISTIRQEEYILIFKLILSQVLHKVAKHPISAPYIVKSKLINQGKNAWIEFKRILKIIINDINNTSNKVQTSKVFLHDSRQTNNNILENSIDSCITSPPYLNNLDYGETSKVHTHFFGITSNWNDITNNVRSQLITASTTHYKDSQFSLESFHEREFARNNSQLMPTFLDAYKSLKIASKEKKGKKSFHILSLLYFEDMYKVLKEIKRSLKDNSKAYLILGDSAPYGIYIDTTKLLGESALSVGFNKYNIYKIRDRGGKWTSLKHRHNIKLTENILVLE